MSVTLEQFDTWLTSDTGAAALVIREPLMPVEGNDGVLFPATFASGDNFPGGYNIDGDLNGKNVCLIDSVGSQANRIEPIFAKPDYTNLVPQVVVKAGEKQINLLDAGHRAGDALVRCSSLQKELKAAFQAAQDGNAEPLAKIAPTSLVFGVWDSRDTQAKLPRLIASTVRAYDVRKLTRSAQFVPATEYVERGLLVATDDKKLKDAYAVRGFVHVPASNTHGGVIATGGVRRDATLSLAALRLLSCGTDKAKTVSLRRYVLGLSLTAFTHPPAVYLRQGCNLVLDASKPREFVEVHVDGKRLPVTLTHADALAYARAAAAAFGIGQDRSVTFEKQLAVEDVSGGAGDAPVQKKPARK